MTQFVAMRDGRTQVDNANDFGRVAVLLGGYSPEREVSLESGKAVLDALRNKGVNAHAWDPAEHTLAEFAAAGFDRAWIALHGTGGEDGSIQGALEWLDTPYTGSGVMASAVAMDKVRSKRLFEAAGLPTPEFAVVRHRADAIIAAETFGFPLILKPASQGSSVGMTKVFEADELNRAADLALSYGGVALAERCIVGDEVTVSVLQGEALPSICIKTPRVFYDYRAKYESDSTEYICPSTEDAARETNHADIALAAFAELGCSGWGRVDFMTDDDGQPYVLEVNTVPGMTSHSLVPMAAKQAGIDFDTLCWRILETSMRADTTATHIEVAANDA
ncbi:MAG: D-alanine--D-alanine ligase [Pseudomonadota bacterium]